MPEVQQRVATLGLLDDAGDDVALAAGELLVGHLPLGVTELLEDHLLGRLRADPPAEVLGDGDLLLGQHLHLDALAVLGVDLLEHLLEHPHVAVLGVDLGAEPDEVIVGVGVLLLPGGLVRGGHGLLEALQDRLERDALLSLELAERGDHLGVHTVRPLQLGAPVGDGARRRDRGDRDRPRWRRRRRARCRASSAASRTPSCTCASSIGSSVLTFTRAPMARA